MTATGLGFAGLEEQARLLATGEVTSVELARAALARIEATQPTLNAFRRVRAEAALAEATAADRQLVAERERLARESGSGGQAGTRRAASEQGGSGQLGGSRQPGGCRQPGDSGRPSANEWSGGDEWSGGERPDNGLRSASEGTGAGEWQPLLGVPVAIKDDLDLAGEPTAFGCAGDYPVKETDAELVRLLRAAGAVIVGKTNTPEFGLWPITEGAAFGVTRNPWDLDHTPGGSSGGSAAAVAAGIVAAAVGSDGAGSIRIPAAWSHLVGIKPGRGTLPSPEAFNGITEWGPLARTTADAALLLDVLAGQRHFRAAADRKPGRLRIALSLRPAFSLVPKLRLDPEVRAAVVRLAKVLHDLGHEIVVDDPRYGMIGLNFLPRSLAGVHDWCAAAPDPALLDARTRDTGRAGARLAGRALSMSRRTLGYYQRRVGRIFDRVDVVLAPTSASPPLPVGAIDGLSGWRTDRTVISACPYTWPWNVLGWPGVNVPAGFTTAGLPVGAQLLGPAESEPLLISLAAQLEEVEQWANHQPA